MIRLAVAGIVISSTALVIGQGVGCGGKVVFEDALSSGGAGGASVATTGSGASTGASSSNGGSTSSSNTTGSSTSSSSSVSSSSSSTGGGGGPVVCASGMGPSPQCDNCTQQALNGVCFNVTEDCVNSNACLDFSECTAECFGEVDCCLDCANIEPEGAKLFGDLVDCVVCQECNPECAGFFPGFSTCL